MSTVQLDRAKLGMRTFWRRLRAEARAGRSVVILTGCRDASELPWDIKYLLARAARRGSLGFLGSGLTPGEISLILEVLQWLLLLALVGVVVLFILKRYKFKVRRDGDGGIEISGEPTDS